MSTDVGILSLPSSLYNCNSRANSGPSHRGWGPTVSAKQQDGRHLGFCASSLGKDQGFYSCASLKPHSWDPGPSDSTQGALCQM